MLAHSDNPSIKGVEVGVLQGQSQLGLHRSVVDSAKYFNKFKTDLCRHSVVGFKNTCALLYSQSGEEAK